MDRFWCYLVGFAIALALVAGFLVAKELLEDHRVKAELRAKAIADRTAREIKQTLCCYHIRDFDNRVNQLIDSKLAEKEGERETPEL